MPVAHFSLSACTNTQPQTATDVVHYLTREGAWREHNKDKLPDRDVAYLMREALEVQTRNDLVASGVRNLPTWADENATVFFQEAARSERVNGRYAYVLQFSLPRSLTHAQQMALKDDFIEATMPDKPLLWVKHEPVGLDGHPVWPALEGMAWSERRRRVQNPRCCWPPPLPSTHRRSRLPPL